MSKVDNVNRILRSFLSGLKPPPNITITEWSDSYRFLPSESSAEPGKYDSSRTPYIEEIAYHLSPQSLTQKVSVVKGVQLAFSELANNMIFTYADLYPCPMLFILPTETLCMLHSKDKVWASVAVTPRLRKIIRDRKRENGSSLLDVRFRGGNIKIAWAHSPSTYASVSRRVVIKDDLDRFPKDVAGEGDPSALADKRTDAFPLNRKIYANSSPTTKRESRIWKEYLDGSQALYYMPCPHCKKDIRFEKESFRYKIDEFGKLISDVTYECEYCKKQILEAQKQRMMTKGRWIHKYPKRNHKSYRLPSFYSPFLSWKKIFEEYEMARGYFQEGLPERLKVWVNTREGLPWDEVEQTEEQFDILKLKVELNEDEVPTNTVLLTMAVDVQKDHFWFEVRAWLDNKSWHIVKYGKVRDWQDLEEIMLSDYYDDNGLVRYIRGVAIDSGYRTDEVYEFCKLHPQVAFPIKGSSTQNMTVPYRKSAVIKNKRRIGLSLYTINTKYYKDFIQGRLLRSLALVGQEEELLNNQATISLHSNSTKEIAKQWTSEKQKEITKKNGQTLIVWEVKDTNNPNNHLWDCTVYNTFLGDLFGVRNLQNKQPKQRRRRILSNGI